MNSILHSESYTPNLLLDSLIQSYGLKNDAALSRMLGSTAPSISKIRHKDLLIPCSLLIAIADLTGRDLDDIRTLAGFPKTIVKIDQRSNLKCIVPLKEQNKKVGEDHHA